LTGHLRTNTIRKMTRRRKKGKGGRKYEVLGTFAPDDVLPHITRERTRRDYAGDDGRVWQVRMNSHRYWTFRRSLSCVVCGIEGTVMSLERTEGTGGQPHFNLYATAGDGKRVLMTKDHIEPRSKGGCDGDGNFQTMCTVCNGLKSNHRLTLEQTSRLRVAMDEVAGRVPAKDIRRELDRLAARMAADDGTPAMTAGELAAELLRNPDAVVAVGDEITGHDPVRSASPAAKGALDSDALPDKFISLRPTPRKTDQ